MNNKITIILVDDEAAHSTLIRRHLRKCEFDNEIVSLNSGEQVLNYIFTEGEYKNHPLPRQVVILLDINMPDINGIEVLKTLKSKQTSRHIPVIMFTTSDDPAEIDTCFQLGCNAYFVKPVEQHQFAKKIQELGHFLTLTQIPRVSL